jgi:hypothetical protein
MKAISQEDNLQELPEGNSKQNRFKWAIDWKD